MRITFGAAVTGIALVLACAGSAMAADGAGAAGPASQRSAAVKVHQIPVGGHPGAVAVDQKRGIAWAATGTNLIKISEVTQHRIARLPVDASLVRVDPAAAMVIAVDTARGNIIEISERTGKTLRTFSENVTIEGIVVDTATHTIWYSAGGSVFELNEATGHLLHTVPVASGSPAKITGALAVDSARGLVWVCVDGSGRNPPLALVAEIKESAHRVSKKFGASNDTCTPAVDTATGKVWVAMAGSQVRIIDEKTGAVKILSTIANNGDGIAIDRHANTVVVTNNISGASSVVLVNETTEKVTATIKMGFFPISVAVDSVTDNVYVPIAFKGVVSEFHI